MKKHQPSARIPLEENPLFAGVEAYLHPRLRFGNFVRNARALRNRVAERYAIRLFESHVIGPANHDRENIAQILKRDELEAVGPLEATEQFCRLLHAEVARVGVSAVISECLFQNSARTINQIWHARQLADINRLEYESFVPRLVALVTRVSTKGRLEPVDLPRYGKSLAESLNPNA